MKINSLSPCITTTKVEESRDFYVKHFGAKVTRNVSMKVRQPGP